MIGTEHQSQVILENAYIDMIVTLMSDKFETDTETVYIML